MECLCQVQSQLYKMNRFFTSVVLQCVYLMMTNCVVSCCVYSTMGKKLKLRTLYMVGRVMEQLNSYLLLGDHQMAMLL